MDIIQKKVERKLEIDDFLLTNMQFEADLNIDKFQECINISSLFSSNI